MGWHDWAGVSEARALGLLGALTPQKISMIKAARLSGVVVALDAEPEAQRRARVYVQDLRTACIEEACRGPWVGGKDAGSGEPLVLEGSSRRHARDQGDRASYRAAVHIALAIATGDVEA